MYLLYRRLDAARIARAASRARSSSEAVIRSPAALRAPRRTSISASKFETSSRAPRRRRPNPACRGPRPRRGRRGGATARGAPASAPPAEPRPRAPQPRRPGSAAAARRSAATARASAACALACRSTARVGAAQRPPAPWIRSSRPPTAEPPARARATRRRCVSRRGDRPRSSTRRRGRATCGRGNPRAGGAGARSRRRAAARGCAVPGIPSVLCTCRCGPGWTAHIAPCLSQRDMLQRLDGLPRLPRRELWKARVMRPPVRLRYVSGWLCVELSFQTRRNGQK